MQVNNRNSSVIEVITSGNLSEKQKAEIEKNSTRAFGIEKAEFAYSQDASLIGGFVVKCGSRVADLSVKGLVDSES